MEMRVIVVVLFGGTIGAGGKVMPTIFRDDAVQDAIFDAAIQNPVNGRAIYSFS